MKNTLEYTNCDFCGENKTNLFLEAEYEDTKERFKLVKCDRCGLIYLNPRPVKNIIGRYYPKESYYSYQDFNQKKGLNYREWLKKISLEGYYNSKNIFKKIISKVLVRNFLIVVPKEKKGRLLDIGCGSGEFLNQMKGFGWEVYGVEISMDAVEKGKRMGLNIHCGELNKADFPNNSFDVVVLSQSLEHVYSPRSYLEDIYRILKPEGSLIIGVPNINCTESKILEENWHGLDVPRHLYFFSTTSLKHYLEKCGFKVEKIKSKKFSLPLKGIITDLKAVVQNKCKDKSFPYKLWTSLMLVFQLFYRKISKFLFAKDKVNELGVYIGFFARKPASGKMV